MSTPVNTLRSWWDPKWRTASASGATMMMIRVIGLQPHSRLAILSITPSGWEPAAVGKQARTLFVVNDDGDNERPASSREILRMLRFGMDPSENMRDG